MFRFHTHPQIRLRLPGDRRPALLLLALVASCTLCLPCDPALAAPAGVNQAYYVAPSGNDTLTCAQNSQSSPFATVQRALQCAGDGDVISLAPSTPGGYPGIGTVDHNVTIEAGAGANARDVEINVADGDYTTPRELTVAAGATAVVQGVTLTCADHSCLFPNVTNQGTLTLDHAYVTGAGHAAGVENLGDASTAKLTVLDSTIADNTNDGGGVSQSLVYAAGIVNQGGNGTGVTIVNSTIAHNQATGANSAGGIIDNVKSGTTAHPVHAANTIIASNTSDTGSPDCSGEILDSSGGHNLLGDPSACQGLTEGQNGDMVGTAAALQPLADHGGPTDTVGLLSESPAIADGDLATCQAAPVSDSDQRGDPRNSSSRGQCDIGAYDTGGGPASRNVTVYVSPAGSDSVGCSQSSPSNPMRTIQYALSCQPDTVILAPSGASPYPGIGTLPGSVTIEAAAGADARSVKIDVSQPADNQSTGAAGGEVLVPNTVAAVLTGVTLDCASHKCLHAAVTNQGTLRMQGDTVTGQGLAVGVHNASSGSIRARLTVLDSTIAGNTNAEGFYDTGSGGLDSTANGAGAPELTIANSTIADNVGENAGSAGGVYAAYISGTTLINDTIADNRGMATGGVFSGAGGTEVGVLASNTLIAGNQALSQTGGADCQGKISDGSGGHNLLGDPTGCGGLTNGQNGDQVGVSNPGLAAGPADNGGSTDTIALQAGSPATGHADAPTCQARPISNLDQRGYVRHAATAGTCDIGAYEYGAAVPNRTLTVTEAGNGSGTVTSAPAGIDCGSTCSSSYQNRTEVTLTAAPATGSTLAGWTGCDSSNAEECTVSMNSDRTVTATFSPASSTGGSGSVNGSGNGNPHGARTSPRLHVRSIRVTPLPRGCTAKNRGAGCRAVTLILSGTINRHANGQKVTVTLRIGTPGRPSHVRVISAQARVVAGRWRVTLTLVTHGSEPNRLWTFRASYRGNSTLLSATVSGGIRVK